jgi:predicted nucleotidyltransferase
MTPTATAHITPDELSTVRAILTEHLPRDVRVYVFGSRAGGKPRRFSDLDLSLEGAEPLSLIEMARLREAFEESLLPWKVDLIDRAAVSPAFGRIIDATKLALF